MKKTLKIGKREIGLQSLDSKLENVGDRLYLSVAGVGRATPLATTAARAFFGVETQTSRGQGRGRMMKTARTPAVFVDDVTGLIRMASREILISFKRDNPTEIQEMVMHKFGLELRRATRRSGRIITVLKDPNSNYQGASLVDLANEIGALPEVNFASPNFVSEVCRLGAPRIPRDAWHLETIGAKQAWRETLGSRDVVVAVLDDGVDVDHPNLSGNILRRPDPGNPDDEVGRDFFVANDTPDHYDPRPKIFQYPFEKTEGNDIHGTCCAGLVASIGRDRGALGVAPDCKLLAVKIFHADRLADESRMADAIEYAASHAQVLSCSWSMGESPIVAEAIEDAARDARSGKGAVLLFAAGNEEGDPVAFPAREPDAIAVGASTDEDKLAWYSNVGPEISIVAPSNGGTKGIFTTDLSYPNRGYNIGEASLGDRTGQHTNDFGGTSAATPIAAGVAALVLSANPDLTAVQVREILERTAQKIGPSSSYDSRGHSEKFGHGRTDADAAVQTAIALRGMPTPN